MIKTWFKMSFCMHPKWLKTGYVGSLLVQWTCHRCGKTVEYPHFDRPIDYIEL